MKRATVVGIVVGLVCFAIAAPIVRNNWSNLMDMRMSGEDRVARAFRLAEGQVKRLCEDAKVSYPPKRIHLRAFKAERQLEVWASGGTQQPYVLIETYHIAGMSGTLGPKRKEGDLQVPEGFYHIDRFNPQSRFRLSLGLNYPNASDRIRSDAQKPGSDIFIHGDRRSIGCLAMTDEKIDQIYILCLQARDQGQTKIPVHVFPFRMTQGNMLKYGATGNHLDFWNELKPAFDQFERFRFAPVVKTDSKGKYVVNPIK